MKAKIGSQIYNSTERNDGDDYNKKKPVKTNNHLKSQKIKTLFETIKGNPEVLTVLKENPAGIKEHLKLEDEELSALKKADIYIVAQPVDPIGILDKTTMTFQTGSTITVNVKDLNKEELFKMLKRAVWDQDYAEKIKPYI